MKDVEKLILNLMALSGMACVNGDWATVRLYENELAMYGVDSSLRDI